MSQTVEPRPVLFLDSTVQIARVLGPPERRQAIERTLSQDVLACTVAYVYMEYQRTVGSDMAHVHRILLGAEEWGTAVARVAAGQRLFRPRSLARVNRILGETLNRSHLNRAKGLLFLATYLDYRLSRLFWRQIRALPDLIHCDLVAAGVTRQADGSYAVADACRKEEAACRLPEFLAGRRPELRAVADYLAAHPQAVKDQTRVERLLAAVLADPRAVLGQGACWPLGDVVIALHAPDGAALWSLDPDFEALAAALGLRRYAPPTP